LDKESGVLQKLAAWLSTHTLSQLQVLSISCPPSSYDVYTVGNHDRRIKCYEQWRMPVLRRLELSNILPGTKNAYDGILTSFQLTIDSSMLLNQHNKGHIWSFLQSSPSLTRLTLSILSNFPNSSSLSLGPVVLPHLRTLRLENRQGMSVEAFKNALTFLCAPVLDCLHLETEFSFLHPNDYVNWVTHIFPLLGNFDSVSDLTLLFKASHARKENAFPAEGLSYIFHALPRLRRMHFGCKSPYKMQVLDPEVLGGIFKFTMSDCAGTDYLPLTRMCWHNCTVSDLYLTALLRNLVVRPSWSAFEALQFVGEGRLLSLPKADVERLLASEIAVISWAKASMTHLDI